MSDSDDDNIVRYGTQLEPYEEDHTCAMPKTNGKLKASEKKKLRKLLAANVNVNKAREVCHLSWPEICQVIPGIEHITPENNLNAPMKTKKKHPKVRVRPMECLSREIEPNQKTFWHGNSGPRVITQTSQDRGTSPNYWKPARLNMPSPVRIEHETNEESLHQPYRPPLTYTREVLPTTHPNNWEELGSTRETAYETNRRKRTPSVGEPSWEPLNRVTKCSQVNCGEPNYWKRDRSPPKSRHNSTSMNFRSNNSYERTQLKYSDTDTLQVKVQDGMRAVNRHYSDNSNVNPFSDQPYKASKTSSECSASLNYWLEPDRPSRLGLRNETHPTERAHAYSDSDDKKLKVSKYHANSWERSVNLCYRESDRPLRNGFRVETQTMATICVNDESDEEYRGRNYKTRTPVDDSRGHLDFSDPNCRETKSEKGCHSRWDKCPEHQKLFEDNDKNVKKDAGPICVAICNVTPMTNIQMTLVLQSINHAIVRIGVQGAGPTFSGSTHKTGWILMNCENPMSRKWLEMEVPLLKPWPEANLSIMPPGDVPESRHSLSFSIPNNEGVNVSTALELLRVQNPGLNTENWEVLTVKKRTNCQIVLLTVDEASFEALRLLEFSANLGTNKVGFLVMSGPSVPSAYVNSSAENFPLASSSAFIERESNSVSSPHENTTTTVSRKKRRKLRNVHITHSQTSGNKPSLPGRRVLLPTPGGSARPTLSLPQVNASVGSPERLPLPDIGLAQASRLQPQANSHQSKKRWYPIPDQSYPSSIGLRDEVPTKRKYQQAPDQFAVDEHGRRRFHGAFTGGFSAGFGNTVGSQEGWTPSTFKSSRADKASFSNQRPEDYMDEEDCGEFGIAPRQVQTHHEFSGQKRPHRTQYHDGPIPGQPVLQQLVRAVHETAAVRMLRAMGWKEGQGTGERLSGKGKKKAREQHKVYGCYMPPELRQGQEEQNQDDEDGADSSDSEYDFDTLFAPDDYEPYILHRKNDRFGLGYSGLSRHSVLGNLTGEYGNEAGSSRSHLVMKDKGKRVSIRGQAFGVGAFEKDDEDIYANEDMSHYDFSIGGPAPVSEKKKTVQKTGHVIQGFMKASKPLPSVPTYAAPALPRDYVPAVAGARRSRFEPTTQQPRDQGLGRHELSAKARGELLGEAPLPPQPLPPTLTPTEDPIAKLLGKTVNFVTLTEKTELDYIPLKDSGKPLTRVFKPFVGNPEKQKRYERFVENKGVVERDGDVDKLQEWEREREMAEFEQAAKLYRPLSGVMGDRFTHASEPDEGTNTLLAVARSSTNHGLATKEQMEAAQQGLYGVMTRQQTTWRPEAMLCRRFNVPEIGGTRNEQKKEDRPKVSYSIFSYLESSVHDKDSFAKEQSKFSGSRSLTTSILPKPDQTAQKTDQVIQVDQNVDQNAKEIIQVNEIVPGFNKRMTVAELFLKESEKTKNLGAEVTDTINKFDKMDLYKSIFLSDSEEEEDKDKSNNNEGKDFIDVPKNVERNTSPPRGIFANIDFDELNSWRRTDEPTKKSEDSSKKVDNGQPLANNSEDSSKKVESAKSDVKTNEEEAMYGPKIPENLQKRLQSEDSNNTNEIIDVGSSSSEDSWVDVNEVKSKKHKKKKSKKHKSKHKKKSKSKKKDR